MSTSTVSSDPIVTISMGNNSSLQVNVLEVMGPGLWHIWMIAAFSALEKYANRHEYDEFLERFAYLLEQRVETGVW